MNSRFLARARGRLVLAFLILLCLAPLPMQAAERQVLRGHVPANVSRQRAVGKLPASQSLDLAIALPLRNQEALSNLLAQIYDPASPNYRHYLTPQEFAERFGPTEQDYQRISAF